MRTRTRLALALSSLVGLGLMPLACNSSPPPPQLASTGDACGSNSDCTSDYCIGDPFPGGYCSSDCTTVACADGEACQLYLDHSLCLKVCQSTTDCRDGYSCGMGACIPACNVDSDCQKGYGCTSGDCTPLPGKPVGGACTADSDCSSQDCEPATSTCQTACAHDAACPSGQTCYVNYVASMSGGDTDGIRPICIAQRTGKAATGASCTSDGDCLLGQCLLSHCTTLCQNAGDCSAPLGCSNLYAEPVDPGPKVKGCIPQSGTLDVDLGDNADTPFGIPDNAISLSFFIEAQDESTTYYAGFSEIDDPSGNAVYSSTVDPSADPIRFQPHEGAAGFMISNSPSVTLVPLGLYSYYPLIQSESGGTSPYHMRAKIKLAPAPPTSGKLALHVHITNLAGGCTTFNAAQAPSVLADFEGELKTIFAQGNITLDDISYFDSSAPSTMTLDPAGPALPLDSELTAASKGGATGVLDIVIVKHIGTSGANNGLETLGISAAIPGSDGIPGTVLSGVAVSLTPLCMSFDQLTPTDLAVTVAHELGHSLGLYHNIEMDGSTDQFTDDDSDGMQNLMYWEEGDSNGTHLSPGQLGVYQRNPVVRP